MTNPILGGPPLGKPNHPVWKYLDYDVHLAAFHERLARLEAHRWLAEAVGENAALVIDYEIMHGDDEEAAE